MTDQETIRQLTERAERAEAALAEMRVILVESKEPSCTCPRCARIDRALSSDCGKGWLSPEKAHQLLTRYGKHDFACYNIYHSNECVCGLNEVLRETEDLQ